ncbi:MAG: hypothetical protein AVDCRST_MAG41-148, partial [uncultured Corynebacteriales bacterium]
GQNDRAERNGGDRSGHRPGHRDGRGGADLARGGDRRHRPRRVHGAGPLPGPGLDRAAPAPAGHRRARLEHRRRPDPGGQGGAGRRGRPRRPRRGPAGRRRRALAAPAPDRPPL